MIKIIDGRRYNTETAEQLYYHGNGHYAGDFRLREKTLYRTQSGAFFIHHEGGAMTDMAVSVGNNGMGGSQNIEAISDDDAYAFLQAHSTDNNAQAAIGKYFADRVVDA